MHPKKILKICTECKSACCKLAGADFTKKEMQRIVKSGAKIKFNKESENHYEFKTNGKGVCAYLMKNGACEIHRVRPNACRCWPVEYPEFKNGKKIFFLADCPLTKYLSKKEIQELKKLAEKITKKISDECMNKTKVSKREMAIAIKRYNKFKMKEMRI